VTKRNEQADRAADRRYRAKLIANGTLRPERGVDGQGRFSSTGLTPIHIPAHRPVFRTV